MNYEEIYKLAKNEAEWLKYYGHFTTREAEKFEDANFYDRIESIGYTKRVLRLDMRCAKAFITSDVDIIGCECELIKTTSGPGDHKNNIYTPLEYVIGSKMDGYMDLIKIINTQYGS